MSLIVAMLFAQQVLAAERSWEDIPAPFDGTAEVHGYYSSGCILGAQEIPITTDLWEVVNNSRNRNFAHPVLMTFLQKLGTYSAGKGYGKLILGDTSLPGGGKLAFGHASHQLGIEADIRFDLFQGGEMGSQRNGWPEVDIAELKYTNEEKTRWTCRILDSTFKPEYLDLVRYAAMDAGVNRIFVSPSLKVRLCEMYDSKKNHPAWLLKVRPYFGHTAHFHVRLECPSTEKDCTPQPLVGDPTDKGGVGCEGNSLHWWLTGEDLNEPDPNPPPPPAPPELPEICKQALAGMNIVKLSREIRCAGREVGRGSDLRTHLRCHDYGKHRNFAVVSKCRLRNIARRPRACVRVP